MSAHYGLPCPISYSIDRTLMLQQIISPELTRFDKQWNAYIINRYKQTVEIRL